MDRSRWTRGAGTAPLMMLGVLLGAGMAMADLPVADLPVADPPSENLSLAAPPVTDSPASARVQIEGPSHPGPRGYHAMCARAPMLCSHDRQAGRAPGMAPPARLTAARRAELSALNARFNARIRPVPDGMTGGFSDAFGDHWHPATDSGDCEDYAIAKKQALIGMGWAADQLLLAVVEGRERGHHAVLVVRTHEGDHVLDNLTDEITPWQETGYRFVIRQSAANPHAWVHLGAARSAVPDRIVTR